MNIIEKAAQQLGKGVKSEGREQQGGLPNRPVGYTRSALNSDGTLEARPVKPPVNNRASSSIAPAKRRRYMPLESHREVVLDENKLTTLGAIIPDAKRSRIKEEYRHIKRPLLMNAAGKGAHVADHPNLIMVTSSKPGEGKTFTAINLALSIASERDRTVLLVDADVVKPSLSRQFDLNNGLGLVDFLVSEEMTLSEVVVKTSLPSLSILPTGKNTHPYSTELLASNNMRELAHELSVCYPEMIVVFDSPPLLVTSEASVLAQVAGQIVMVVEAEETRQHQVNEAIALLDQNRVTGFVLNKSRRLLNTDYYYGYYGYGYGYGEER